MGSIRMFQLLNDIFTFKGVKKYCNEKKYVDRFIFLPLHIYKKHMSPPDWKMCPIPNLPLIGKNIIIFPNKTF